MTEYNKRVLKNVLEDMCEENDKVFLKEIEEIKNEPRFANTKDTDKKIQKALSDSAKGIKKKHRKKAIIRVASVILVLLACVSVATLSVKGFREKIWEFLTNIGNPSYSLFVSSGDDDANKLSAYEGQYIPTWIPDGYEVTLVDNKTHHKIIELKNSNGKTISYTEYPKGNDAQFYIDKESSDSYEVSTVNGREIIIASKNEVITLVVKEKDAIVQAVFNDPDINVASFAELIEKK